jgi:hypothetical protein
METLLREAAFSFVADADKAFIGAFDKAMVTRGYDCGNTICNGACWGRYMVVYRKAGARSRAVYARMYIRESGMVLRMFFSKVDAHREYIAQAPAYIKDVFVGGNGKCDHKHDKDGFCKFRKSYTIEGRLIEKCNGRTFEFYEPSVERLPDYLALFDEFYPAPRRRR